ncbi:MAG: hypothetical protein GX025_03450 [Clostridiales bacterium]|nr:hypothetical protein [Clostridiales bacterium]
MILCDNEVDRDFEKFSTDALSELSELFVGKTGIFDHEWTAKNQTARIYRTELLEDRDILTSLGEPYKALKAFAYMLKSEKNLELISEIEAGIKKEVSIGCSLKKRLCSVCGLAEGGCGHIKGREYEGKLCYFELFDVSDAYEWSFVAVPAQRAAGVVKRFGGAKTLKGFVESLEGSVFAAEYEVLEAEAQLGKRYKQELRREVLRLGLLCDKKLYEALLEGSKTMGEAQLLAMKASFEERLSEKMPITTQISGRDDVVSFDGSSYLV